MKRFKTILRRDKSASQAGPSTTASNNNPEYNFDNAAPSTPEGDVGRNIRLFCESGSMSNGGEEVLHLPSIVDGAESSPVAAAAAAHQVKKFLSREWAAKPHVQYNAIMVMRILCDNPGPTFTRNFDKSFVGTVKEVLRMCKDGSTQQIMRETLDNLEANKEFQEGMGALIQMWRKEKGHSASLNGGSRGPPAGGLAPANDYSYRIPTRARDNDRQERQDSYARRGQLPPPLELASRIEESRNTAKILLQLIQSTPSDEVLGNDLLKEFADRCHSAQKSMSGYINSENPTPDDDTMLTLIETNEQLSLASSRYQRSLLSARKAAGLSPSPNAETMQNNTGGPYQPPTAPPTTHQNDNLFAQNSLPPQQAPNSDYETYQAPLGPPPPRHSTGMSGPLSNDEPYNAPPGPPPAMLDRFNSREGQPPPQSQAPRIPAPEQASDPFADPLEHEQNPPPLAVEPGYYGRSKAARPPHPAHRPHSQTFSVDAGPTYAPGHISGNAYDGSASATAEARERLGHNGDVPEIDGHSEVGRNVPSTPPTQEHDDGANSAYDVSPMESRRALQ